MPDLVTVTVLLFAALRDRAGQDRCELELPDGAPVTEIWPRLPASIRRSAPPAGVRYAVNDRWAEPATPVSVGDRIAIILPVSGG